MPTHQIGTGLHYTTISAWESAQVTGTPTEDIIGECAAEEFNENIDLSGASGTYYIRLRAAEGAEHDGRAYEVSGYPCARIRSNTSSTPSITVSDYCEVSWLEVKQEVAHVCIRIGVNDNNNLIHHNIIHGNGTSGELIAANDAVGNKVYRNIGYGTSGTGEDFLFTLNPDNELVALHNTVFHVGAFGGPQGTLTVERNISFSCIDQDFDSNGANSGDNAASDTTGDTGLDSLVTTDNLRDPDTVNYNQVDLRLLNKTADVYQASSTTYSTSTYPEIDVPISNRYTTLTGTWSVGADDYNSNISRIGTSGDYTTIAAWESNENTGTLTEDLIGECLAEAFSESGIVIAGSTPGSYHVRLRAEIGAEHDGRAHEVSSYGNARIENSSDAHTISIEQDNVEVSWLEVRMTTANNYDCIRITGSRSNILIHHNLLHYTSSANISADCLAVGDTSATVTAGVYRNICYGAGGAGIGFFESTGQTGLIALNTIYYCGLEGGAGERENIFSDNGSTEYDIIANASFDGVRGDITSLTGTLELNATSDTSGDSDALLTSLTTANQFTNPTTTLAAVDLTILNQKAAIYYAVNGYRFNLSDYPEIDTPASSRGTSLPLDRQWAVGADDDVHNEEIKNIGTGEIYTTISSWESSENVGTFTKCKRGELLGESFDESPTISGATPDGYWLRLIAQVGAEHDGRAHAVSGKGNARIENSDGENSLSLGQDHCELGWIEITPNTSAPSYLTRPDNGVDEAHFHHLILNCNGFSSTYAFSPDQATSWRIHRCIAYNGDFGIRQGNPTNSNRSYCLNNTFNDFSNDGISLNYESFSSENATCANCVSFNATNDSFDLSDGVTVADNAADDTTGTPASLDSLTPSNNLVNTTSGSSTDLRIKDDTAAIYQAATGKYAESLAIEIDRPIEDRYTHITDTWSVGAAQSFPNLPKVNTIIVFWNV